MQAENKIDIFSVASTFIGKPYVSSTLDKIKDKEILTVNLDSVDCTTFLEYVLAAVITGNYPEKNDSLFNQNLTKIRYKDGVIDDYTSRLHYFSMWIYDNQKKGIISEVTDSFECVPVNKEINFMSKNTKYYPQLLNDTLLISNIIEDENIINSLNSKYIPKEKVKSQYNKFKEGDIIAITTSVKGLDISHVGFIHFIDNIPYLLHASSDNKRVVFRHLEIAAS